MQLPKVTRKRQNHAAICSRFSYQSRVRRTWSAWPSSPSIPRRRVSLKHAKMAQRGRFQANGGGDGTGGLSQDLDEDSAMWTKTNVIELANRFLEHNTTLGIRSGGRMKLAEIYYRSRISPMRRPQFEFSRSRIRIIHLSKNSFFGRRTSAMSSMAEHSLDRADFSCLIRLWA